MRKKREKRNKKNWTLYVIIYGIIPQICIFLALCIVNFHHKAIKIVAITV